MPIFKIKTHETICYNFYIRADNEEEAKHTVWEIDENLDQFVVDSYGFMIDDGAYAIKNLGEAEYLPHYIKVIGKDGLVEKHEEPKQNWQYFFSWKSLLTYLKIFVLSFAIITVLMTTLATSLLLLKPELLVNPPNWFEFYKLVTITSLSFAFGIWLSQIMIAITGAFKKRKE